MVTFGGVDLLQRCFTGLEMRGDRLIFCPYWPKALGTLSFPLRYRGHRLVMHIDDVRVEVSSEPGGAAPIEVVCRDRIAELAAGGAVRLVDR